MVSGTNSSRCTCPNGKTPTKTDQNTYRCNMLETAVCDLNCKQGECKLGLSGPYCKFSFLSAHENCFGLYYKCQCWLPGQCAPMYEGPRCEKYRCSGFCLNKGLCYQDVTAIVPAGASIPLKVSTQLLRVCVICMYTFNSSVVQLSSFVDWGQV